MTQRMLLANTLGISLGELSEYRYQPGHTRRPIWAIGDWYYAVGVTAPKDIGTGWEKHPDEFWAKDSRERVWRLNMEAADV